MSVISFYKEPKDIFLKLAREGRRAWLATSKIILQIKHLTFALLHTLFVTGV